MRYILVAVLAVCVWASVSARGLMNAKTAQKFKDAAMDIKPSFVEQVTDKRYKRSLGVMMQCPTPERQGEIVQKMVGSAGVQSLVDHTGLFGTPEIRQPVPGVYFLIGWALSNSIVIDAPDGLIVIDTMDSVKAATPAVAALRQITNKAVKAIIYTHNHPDHISGTSVFVAGQDRSTYDIWGYENIIAEFWSKWLYSRPLMLARGFRQVGAPLTGLGPNAIINSGLGPFFVADQTTGLMLNPPDKFLVGNKMAVNIAGLDVELLYIPGETRDQMAILFPDFGGKRMLACGDNYYHMFPNLYAIRGTPPRPVLEWAASVGDMRNLNAEVLLPSHTQPVMGADLIYERFTVYMDAIQYVHDQTIRLMNHGLHPDEIVEQVLLPPALRPDYTLEHYGRVDWSVKTIFEGQMGWFSGYPEELKPLSPKKRAVGIVEAFGAGQVLKHGWLAYDSGNYQQALEFASYLWHSGMDDLSKKENARDLRHEAILKMAEEEVSANGRNYYMTWLLEEACLFDNTYVAANDFATLMLVSADEIFTKMKVMLISDKVDRVSLSFRLTLTDVSRAWDLQFRNSILQIDEVTDMTAAYAGKNADMTLMDLRKFLIGTDEMDTLTISPTGWTMDDVAEVRSYFENAYYQ